MHAYIHACTHTDTQTNIFNSCTSQPDTCLCMDNTLENKASSLLLHVAYGSKLRSVVRSSMHPCQENWVAIGLTDMYNALAAHAFSARNKCWQCTYIYRDSLRHLFHANPAPHTSYIRNKYVNTKKCLF